MQRHVYEVRTCKDHRGVTLISDELPFIIALTGGGVFVFILLCVVRRQLNPV
jgi:hypothetical protein